MTEYITISEAARLAGVSPATIRNWIREGRMRGLGIRNRNRRGRRLIVAVDLDELRKAIEEVGR